MIFYYVILLFLSWPEARRADDVKLKKDDFLDQLATASETLARSIKELNVETRNLREPLSDIPSSIAATVHYENSNGFVPILPSDSSPLSTTNQLNHRDEPAEKINGTNNTKSVSAQDTEPRKFEEDLAYSSEARIFLNLPGSLTNRRSFDFQEKQNEFELLKINNATPAVANYRDFYENVRNAVNSGNDKSQPGHERGKRIENYVRNYGQQNNNGDPYVQYLYNSGHTKKTTHEQKAFSNHQQDIANNTDRGQSAALSSLPRTNYEVNELLYRGNYDNEAESSRARHKLSKPVVVAEPGGYKMDMKLSSQLKNIDAVTDHRTSRNFDPPDSETLGRYDYNDNSRQRSYHRTEDSGNLSNESTDSEYIERTRIQQKNRKRPSYPDSSRRLPKEHRGTSDDSAEDQEKPKYSSLKSKAQRYRMKTNPWTNDANAHHDESIEDDSRDSSMETKSHKTEHVSRSKHTNSWNQISPSLEISHSNGIELDQLERPKFVVPVKLNLVPVTNFDHATALGNSQGFDMSNAVLQNFVTAAPLGAFSTHAPLLSTPQTVLSQNLALPKNLANMQNFAMSTSVPDLIVGQNTFHSPLHTVLLSQANGQNKAANALKTAYLPSTMTPLFALTSSLTPTLQGVRLQSLQDNVTPRTTFAVTPNPASVIQHVPINQVHSGVQQLILPQPTVQTFSSFLQTPLHANTGYQIQVNPHGLQGQNLIGHSNLQMQSLPTMPTLLSGQTIPEGRANPTPEESQDKKNMYTASDTNLLASASMAVGQSDHKFYMQNQNAQQAMKSLDGGYQVLKDIDVTPKTKGFIQATQAIPTVLQSSPTVSGMTVNNQQSISPQQNLQNANLILQRAQDQANDVMRQLQLQLNRQQLMKNTRQQIVDNAASHSSNTNTLGVSSGNAHLPNVGTRNVEIVNPNIKPSPIDSTITMATFDAMRYPTAVLTTPVPIFSTITTAVPQTVSLQNYVDSLTETGVKAAKQFGDLKASSNQERPMFNPSNFVPNVDIIKNQNVLNNKLPVNEPLRHNLNLVPAMPGGNFFKPSFGAQTELMLKPKLATDLQKYAEEMFKESLKTMYNSQKWNNDRKPYGYGQNNSDVSDLAKLRTEVQKLRASLSETKYRELLEAHQSENKVHATDVPQSIGGDKKIEPILSTLEHLLKTRPTGPIHIYHGTGRPSRKRKPPGNSDSNFQGSGITVHDDFNSDSHLREFLTPPRPHVLHSKSPFQNKPMKKRPSGSSRFKSATRSPIRSNSPPSRPNGLDTSATNIDIHFDGSHFRHRSPFSRDNFDSRYQSSFDGYPKFTTPAPDIFNDIMRELKASNKDYDINHPRMHNLLGLLMKNKQLPNRGTQNYYRDRDHLKQSSFDGERYRQQFYDNMLKDYLLNKSDGASQSNPIVDRKAYSENATT